MAGAAAAAAAHFALDVLPKKEASFVPPPDEGVNLHITHAVLGEGAKKGERVFLKCKTAPDDESVLCCLKLDLHESVSLDLMFTSYTEFVIEGTSTASVHLSGYTMGMEVDDDDSFDSGDLDDMDDDSDDDSDEYNVDGYARGYDDDSDDSDDDFEEAVALDGFGVAARQDDKKKKKSGVVIEEITDEEAADILKEKDAKAVRKSQDTEMDDESDEEDESDESDEEDDVPVPEKKIVRGSKRPAEAPVDRAAAATKKATPSKTPPSTSKQKPETTTSPTTTTKTPPKKADATPAKATVKTPPSEGKKQKTVRYGMSPSPIVHTRYLYNPVIAFDKLTHIYTYTCLFVSCCAQYIFAGNGLEVTDLELGKPHGKLAKGGNSVRMRYVGKLKNGKVFDSNTKGQPFQFRLGVGEVIKGWDVGVKGMREGDKRRIVVPPEMGYGKQRVGPIPPNSTLYFDVELVKVLS